MLHGGSSRVNRRDIATLDDQIWWQARRLLWKIEAHTAPAATASSSKGEETARGKVSMD
jgi:hypothetical protein